MGYEATGTIHAIRETKQVSERFAKREFILATADNPKYPQFVSFEATGDRTSLLDNFNVGDEVNIEFSVRGREWRSPTGEVKYFNTLDVWKVSLVKATSRAVTSAAFGSDVPANDDGIPF